MAALEITSNLDIVAQELQTMSARHNEAEKAGLQLLVQHAQSIEVRQVGRIYQRPIPTRAQINEYNRKLRAARRKGRRLRGSPRRIGGKGTPAWKRSRRLLKAVEAAPVWEGKNQVRLSANEEHAEPRHQLGVTSSVIGGRRGWVPKNPALGIVRKNPFADETLELIEPQAVPIFEDGYRRKMGL